MSGRRLYLNPKDISKEEWLVDNAISILSADTHTIIPFTQAVIDKCLPVVLVDNGPFTAAVIAESQEDLDCFLNPADFRPKKVYIVPVEFLVEVTGEHF